MTRWSASAYLASRTKLGIKFGLEAPRAISRAMGHPELQYATLLVAGTNGKGSVVAYVDQALRGAGLRVGRYTSPHLVSVHERIAVNGRPIAARAFESCVWRVWQSAERLVRERVIPDHPTHFEILTCAAFDHFRERGIDVAVVEVGLGARLDATNVCEPLASAIVSVDLDHEALLGHTLVEIAREKAGVLRSARATVLGPMASQARDAIASVARRTKARLVDACAGVQLTRVGGALRIQTPARRYPGLRALPGPHQLTNLVVALRLLEETHSAGLAFDPAAAAREVSRTRWPGRLQWLAGRPRLLLDGAHNAAAARALAAHLEGIRPFVLLFGAMRDKAIEEMARVLFPLARQVVLTRPRIERAAEPSEIARRAGLLSRSARRVREPRRALALARRLARPGEPVVVAGSLYLVGAILEIVREERGSRS